MSTLEKFGDRLGQITFRLETNFQWYKNNNTKNKNVIPETFNEVEKSIQEDIEKLKELKKEIFAHNKNIESLFLR